MIRHSGYSECTGDVCGACTRINDTVLNAEKELRSRGRTVGVKRTCYCPSCQVNNKKPFDKIKFPNKDNVSTLKEQFAKNEIGIKDFPQDVLAELLMVAIARLDKLDNFVSNGVDERYFKDILWDEKCLLNELFEKLERKIELDIYE